MPAKIQHLDGKDISGKFDEQVRMVFALLNPCSALLTISSFARPGMLVEIQGVAVV